MKCLACTSAGNACTRNEFYTHALARLRARARVLVLAHSTRAEYTVRVLARYAFLLRYHNITSINAAHLMQMIVQWALRHVLIQYTAENSVHTPMMLMMLEWPGDTHQETMIILLQRQMYMASLFIDFCIMVRICYWCASSDRRLHLKAGVLTQQTAHVPIIVLSNTTSLIAVHIQSIMVLHLECFIALFWCLTSPTYILPKVPSLTNVTSWKLLMNVRMVLAE